jgi:glycine cleavage system H protein
MELGDLNYVELPNEGDLIMYCEPFGSVECARLVTDLYAPLCGKVVEVNRDVLDNPKLINFSPYSQGWIIRAKLNTLDELNALMSSDAYEDYILGNSP